MEELEINPETASAPEEQVEPPQHSADEESAAAREENAPAEARAPEEHAGLPQHSADEKSAAAREESAPAEAQAPEEHAEAPQHSADEESAAAREENAPAEARAPEEQAEPPQYSADEESAGAREENAPAEARAPEENAPEDDGTVTPKNATPEAPPDADAPEGGVEPSAVPEDTPANNASPDDGSELPAFIELLSPEEAEPVPVAISDEHLQAILECVVYVAEDPLTLAQIASALAQPVERVEGLLRKLVAEFEQPQHGIGIREVAGGYKMATKAEHHEAVRSFVKSLKPPLKLSLPALETLAVIAYKQPVLKTLLDRKLIAGAGRKNVIGKPILYKTTKEFLIQFGLKDIAELPSIKEFEEIRRMAFADAEPAPAEVKFAPAPAAAPEAAPQPQPESAPEAGSEPAAGPIPVGKQTENEPEPPAQPAPATEPEA
jgi:segregation and condensation protein B